MVTFNLSSFNKASHTTVTEFSVRDFVWKFNGHGRASPDPASVTFFEGALSSKVVTVT